MTAPDFRGDPPSHYLCSLLEAAGLPHLFTTRHFPGVSAFREPGPPLGPGAQELLTAGLAGLCRSLDAAKVRYQTPMIQRILDWAATAAATVATPARAPPAAAIAAVRTSRSAGTGAS